MKAWILLNRAGMQWKGKNGGLDPPEWGWDVQRDKLLPFMMDNRPAPDALA